MLNQPVRLALALAFAVAASLVLSAWAEPPVDAKKSDADQKKSVTVTEKDADKTVKVPQGGVIAIQLPDEGASGRAWKVVKNDPKQLEPVLKKAETVPGPKEKTPGQTLFAIFHFKALKSGEVELHYVSSADGDKKTEKVFKVRVEVEPPK